MIPVFVVIEMTGCKKKDSEDREDSNAYPKEHCLLMTVSEQFRNMPDIVSSHFYSYNQQKQLVSDSIPGYVEKYFYNENNLIDKIDRFSNGRFVSFVDFLYEGKILKSASTYMDYGGAFDLVSSSVFKYEKGTIKREEVWEGHIDEPLTMTEYKDYLYKDGSISSATLYTLQNDSSFKPKSRILYTFSNINSDTTLNIHLLRDPVYFQNKKIFLSTQSQNFISKDNTFESRGIIEDCDILEKSSSERTIAYGNYNYTYSYNCR